MPRTVQSPSEVLQEFIDDYQNFGEILKIMPLFGFILQTLPPSIYFSISDTRKRITFLIYEKYLLT